jgi:hypothetical protein
MTSDVEIPQKLHPERSLPGGNIWPMMAQEEAHARYIAYE